MTTANQPRREDLRSQCCSGPERDSDARLARRRIAAGRRARDRLQCRRPLSADGTSECLHVRGRTLRQADRTRRSDVLLPITLPVKPVPD